MEFWNSLLIEKSWNLLQELKKKPFKFIVIGGWATYLWTKTQKSKDIDIVVKDFKNLEFLKNIYSMSKNDKLKKYEIKIEEIDIDIYVPFYSKLAIPLEELINYTTKIEGFEVPEIEILLILKQGAELERKESVKGLKDRLDILALFLYSEIDFKKYYQYLKKYKIEHFLQRLKKIISSFTLQDASYFSLNPRELKLNKQRILKDLDKI